jgi:hypothetical protein
MIQTTISEETISEALALRVLVKRFIEDNKIRCAESVYQTDCVAENSLEFIESLCEVVGYCEE